MEASPSLSEAAVAKSLDVPLNSILEIGNGFVLGLPLPKNFKKSDGESAGISRTIR
jgi:hypothetical protein